jgi:hypothetical protein
MVAVVGGIPFLRACMPQHHIPHVSFVFGRLVVFIQTNSPRRRTGHFRKSHYYNNNTGTIECAECWALVRRNKTMFHPGHQDLYQSEV